MRVNENPGPNQELMHVESITVFHPGCGGEITSCPAPFGAHAIISIRLESKKTIEIVADKVEVGRLIRTLQQLHDKFSKEKSTTTRFVNSEGIETL